MDRFISLLDKVICSLNNWDQACISETPKRFRTRKNYFIAQNSIFDKLKSRNILNFPRMLINKLVSGFGFSFSHAWFQIRIFPCLAPNWWIPVLRFSSKFSRAWHRLRRSADCISLAAGKRSSFLLRVSFVAHNKTTARSICHTD